VQHVIQFIQPGAFSKLIIPNKQLRLMGFMCGIEANRYKSNGFSMT